MKSRFLFAGSLAAAVVLVCGVAMAQDPVKVGPHVYTKTFENDKVRVSTIQFNPGDVIAMHSHPDHLLYVLDPGTLELSYPDGKTNVFEGQAGQVVWIPAESHAAKNIGDTTFHALVVELKPLPYPEE